MVKIFNGKKNDRKEEYEEYCRINECNIFQEDINEKGAKRFVAAKYKDIYNKIQSGEIHFYEYFLSSQNKFKLFIDYDKKIKLEKDNVSTNSVIENESDIQHKKDIKHIIETIRLEIPEITDVYIIKSIPDTLKKSYHIIFDGVYFEKKTQIISFIKDIDDPLIKYLSDKKTKIIDDLVYGDRCFRMLMCSKPETPLRPLYLLDTNEFLLNLNEVVIENISYEIFLKTCIGYVTEDCVKYKPKTKTKKNKKLHLINEDDILSDKELVRKYLDILDKDRYTDRNKWLNIGYILYSINKDYIDLWHYFSKKWNKYNENEVNIAWDSFNSSEYIYTVHNLIYLAKIDNEKEYLKLKVDIPTHDLKYLRPFDNIISKYIYRLYGDRFVCSNPKNNEWYYFNGTRWVLENKSYNLRKLMINDVFTKVSKYRKKLLDDTQNEVQANEEIIKNYYNIEKMLGSGLKLHCLELEFYNSKFYDIIDQNKDLIGFDNGVYDLTTHEFRKGTDSDYISLSVKYEYIEYKQTSKEYNELMELIEKIIPNKDVREFTLKALSSCLDGHIRDENFYIFSGKNNSGGNGKSTITDLLLNTLGEYGIMSPVSLITGKREGSSNANSALASIKNKRFILMQEPEATDQIQVGTLKGLTGGDRISTRELHSSQIEFKPHAKIFLCCNTIPNLSSIDGGVMRRLKIIEFTSKFVLDPKAENEYKIDLELKNRLNIYRPVFFCILRDYYKLYKKTGLNAPKEVMKVTMKYENDNNIIKQFQEENLIKSTKKHYITKERLKEIYKNDSILKRAFPKFSFFITQLESTLCSEFIRDNNEFKLFNWKLKSDYQSDNDDDDDDDNENKLDN